jgi:NAD(P)-dependent dehydrogenase (short-subunit alcohol dehydrogenase family)
VLVTGGSRGIGLMIAQGFVAAGATVVISSRKADACAAAAAQLNGLDIPGAGSAVAYPADLSTEEGLASLTEQVTALTPRLDVLINNAGAVWGAPLGEFPDAAFDKVLNVNVKAVFSLTQRLLPLLRAAATDEDPARVINIGSVDGLVASATNNYSYVASKAAVHMLTKKLAADLAADRITVNAIAPGPFQTKMTAFFLDDPAGREAFVNHVPLGRLGVAEDMAGTAIFLASRAGSYLTGTIIPVDGGVSGAR